MSSMNQVASDLYKALTESDERKPQSYDIKATVLREEGNIVWVKIPGGIDETPVQKTNNANPGDEVIVRLSGGRAYVLGNNTNPATDNTVANAATQLAEGAGAMAMEASEAAASAQEGATRAWAYADSAMQAAHEADAEAERAKDEADEATRQANTATRYANASLDQLRTVQDVIGVLDWATSHGSFSLTTDTEVQEGKVYFIFDAISGDYEPVVDPKDSELSTYYELTVTEAMQSFIMAHLAVTSRGLWVLPNGIGSATDPQYASNYKALLSNEGLLIYDGNGLLVSTFSESIRFSSDRSQYIGGPDAYIAFNAIDGTINIGGNKVTFGREGTLNDILSQKVDVTNAGGQAVWNNGTFRISSVGPNGAEYAVQISGTGIELQYMGKPATNIDQDQLIINKTVVVNEMKLGGARDEQTGSMGPSKWSWKIDPNDDSIFLKWIG